MSLLRLTFSRTLPVLYLSGLSLFAQSGCREELVGPQVEPEPRSNACLDLQASASSSSGETQTDPEDLLPVFDCLNSAEAFDALRAPLAYTIDQGYLDPYFLLPGYLDPLNLDENVQGGDLSLTISSLHALLTDPDDPIGALLDVYVDLYNTESALSTEERPVSHLEALLRLSQLYTGAFYDCEVNDPDCRLITMVNELYYSDAVAVLKANSAETSAQIDPKLAEDITYGVLELARASTSQATGGDNLLLGITESLLVAPAPSDPYKTVDDVYVASGRTFLQSMQQPLCQLRSDVELVHAESTGGSTYTLSLLPTWLSTLNAYDPNGRLATDIPEEIADVDNDLDGVSLAQGDCNDADATIYPRAPELFDRKDNDCDLVVDGYSDTTVSEMDKNDNDGDRVPPNGGDCNDADASIHPAYKISSSDGSVVVIEVAPEFDLDGNPDLKDNDCDGFVDRIGSSLEILLNTGRVALPALHAPVTGGTCGDGTDNDGDGRADKSDPACAVQCRWVDPDGLESSGYTEFGCNATPMHALLATLNANSELVGGDMTAMLYQFSDYAETLVSNYSNGIIGPDLTAQVRVALPVVFQMASLGMLSSSSVEGALALHGDYITYKQTCLNTDGTLKSECTTYTDSCGEQFDPRQDTLQHLTELIRIIDGYSLLNEPHLLALIPVLAESGLLYDLVEVMMLGLDENGQSDPAIKDAVLELFDYFIAPPEGTDLYVDNYEDARLWDLVGMVTMLWDDPRYVEEIDALMSYLLYGIDDPTSPLYQVPDALEALSGMETGGSTNTEAILEVLIDPQYEYLLLNALAPMQDENLINILVGDWEALPDEVEAQYRPENGESTLDFMARWIGGGKVDALLDMAADLLTWVVENTRLDELASDATPTPTPGPTE